MDKLLWLSLLPPLLSIGLAIVSKRILPSLLLGLLLGGYLLFPTPFGGIETTIDYLVKTLTDKGNLQVLLFLYLFSGFIFLIKRSGAIKAFSSIATKHIKTKRGVFFSLWGLIPFTFIDCGFRVVAAGNITRAIAKKNRILPERLAFILNNTSAPIVELIPFATTFVGYNINIIQQGLDLARVTNQTGYGVLLKAIPLEFFSFVVLLVTFISVAFVARKEQNPQDLEPESSAKNGQMEMEQSDQTPEISPRLINLILPLISIITLSIFFFWYIGKENSKGDASFISVIKNSQPNKAMLVALFVSMIFTAIIYLVQKYPLGKMAGDVISGGNELMKTLAILVLAWSLAALSQDLGLSTFIQQEVGSSLPIWSIAVTLFLVSGVVTYFLGSGWGATSLIMPFAIPLAVSSGAGVPLVVAAVISGGTFGDITSPVSGMANMSSSVAKADHMKYIAYASRYNFLAAGIAAVLFIVASLFFG